jgi:hypothetical protein
MVRIDDVIVARSDGAAAEPLPDGLARKTYTEPIILREDMVLVDGLRRLLWHRAQGRESIPAIVVSTFMEAMDVLRSLYADAPRNSIPARRVWDLVSTLYDYSITWSKGKATGGWLRQADGKYIRRVGRTPGNRTSSVRSQYCDALNLSEHMLQSTVYLYRRAEAGDALAQAIIKQVEAGDFGIVRGQRLHKHPNNLTGNVTSIGEQRRILRRGAEGLSAQVAALQKLGYPIVVPPEELAEAIQGFVDARSGLTTLISGLRKVLNERENHG